MATSRRSALDLADMVEAEARPSAGAPVDVPLPEDVEKAAHRARMIETIMKERSVPKAIAVIMVDKGYSRGTAFRIWNDEQKRLTKLREEEHKAAMEKKGRKEAAA